MSLSSHLQELKKKHQNLSAEVEVMQRSPAVDEIRSYTDRHWPK